MITTKYSKFLLNMLCESVMISTPEFRLILSKMEDNNIAGRILQYVNNEYDIKTAYNAIGLSDTNDEITFIPDNQFQRAKTAGENPWTKTKSKSKVGRMVRQILTDNGYNINDTAIEKFVNEFKATWDKMNSTNRKTEVVKGDKVLYWYDCKNYASTAGILGNSCMRKTEYNYFLQLYASNPDKISMVIITEDDKLLARALLWKLDESSNGKKLFLDRIYTRYDNDSKFLYDWVLENVLKGKEEELGSHRMGNGGDMIVNLEKAKFEAYPYADTFMFLYKKIVDGKATGEGFISNKDCSRNKGKSDEYVMSILQETSGNEDVRSHRKSASLDKWISKDEAAYIRSMGDYIYKKDAKHCKVRDEWYLDSEAIFSERMNDWIPKDRAVNDPRLGWIMRDYIVEAIMEYTGDKTSPVDIYRELQSSSYEKFIKKESFVRNEIDSKIFKPYNQLDYISAFDIKFKIRDWNGSNQVDILCYEIYKTRSGIGNETLSMMAQCYKGGYYITKSDSDFYGIEIDTSTKTYIHVEDYLSSFDYMFYRDYQGGKSKFKESPDHDKFIQGIHDYKMYRSRDYRETYEREELKNNGIKFVDVLAKISTESIDQISSEINLDQLIKREIRSESYSYSNLDTDVNTSIVRKLLPVFYSFYLVRRDSRTAKALVKEIMRDKFKELSDNNIEILSTVTRNIIIDEIRYSLSGLIESLIDKWLSEDNIKSSVGPILNMFENIPVSEVSDFYKKSDL